MLWNYLFAGLADLDRYGPDLLLLLFCSLRERRRRIIALATFALYCINIKCLRHAPVQRTAVTHHNARRWTQQQCQCCPRAAVICTAWDIVLSFICNLILQLSTVFVCSCLDLGSNRGLEQLPDGYCWPNSDRVMESRRGRLSGNVKRTLERRRRGWEDKI